MGPAQPAGRQAAPALSAGHPKQPSRHRLAIRGAEQRPSLVTCYRIGMVKQVRSLASEHLDDASALSSEQEQGIEQALASLQAGKGRSLEEVRQTIRAASAKRR
jgi:hypothetical protein